MPKTNACGLKITVLVTSVQPMLMHFVRNSQVKNIPWVIVIVLHCSHYDKLAIEINQENTLKLRKRHARVR